MKTFYLTCRVLGGVWVGYSADGVKITEYGDLSQALGMAETLRSAIKEVMVGSIVREIFDDGHSVTQLTTTYDLIEHLPPL